MPQIIEQPDIFQRVGQGFGQGVGEQTERGMLSRGIQDIAANKDLSEVQRYAKLFGLPGGAEHAQHVIPALQRAQQADALKKRLEGQQNVVPSPSVDASPMIKEGEAGKFLHPPSEVERVKQKLHQPFSQQQIDQEALRRYSLGEGTDINALRSMVQSENQTNLASQKAKFGEFSKRLNEEGARVLQIPGLDDYNQTIGQITQALIDNAEVDIDKGSTPEAAEKKVRDAMLKLSERMNQVRSTSGPSFIPGSGINEKSRIADLRAAKKEFENYGFGEIFNDLAAGAAGITSMKAASVLSPLENEAIKKQISKEGKGKFIHAFTSRLSDKDYDSIVDKIKPSDNILSVEHALRENRISIPEFKEALRKKYDDLTPQQQRQFSKTARNSIFDDLLFETF